VLASVVISTYNRADALEPTLKALADQDVDASEYEVLVVDDGSTDATQDVLQSLEMPYRLRLFRLEQNSGVSAGRNVGLRNAEGRWIIMLSDDLIVPANFISTHAATLERFPGTWVVGGFTQLDDLTATPFGRFLDKLESSFEVARTGRQLEEHVYEMRMPTARNLSLPRSDLDRIGLFDEQFRVTCEDQDLAKRAGDVGVTFIYTDAVECVHNDQAADLRRYGRFQQRGARDTVRLVRKYPELHGNAPIVHVNGPIRRSDAPATIAKKLVKRLLGNERGIAVTEAAVRLAEGARLPDSVLAVAYRFVISLYTFSGWREGLSEAARP
jgi:glycosyltransferase involved in cell wall biosynthesis